jgi:hypothetical protein
MRDEPGAKLLHVARDWAVLREDRHLLVHLRSHLVAFRYLLLHGEGIFAGDWLEAAPGGLSAQREQADGKKVSQCKVPHTVSKLIASVALQLNPGIATVYFQSLSGI